VTTATKDKVDWESFNLRTEQGNLLICIARHKKWVDPQSQYYILYPEGTRKLWAYYENFDIDKMTKKIFQKSVRLGLLGRTKDLIEEGIIDG